MLILGIDTSGKNGSVAIVRFTDDGAETLEIAGLEGGTFSAQLVPQIAEMLDRQGLTKRDIGGFSVVSGPGSFTGLRVGLAAVKALAEILEKPIAATSLLEALAHACAEKGNVTAVLDAGRGELFAGESEIEDGRVKLVDEGLLSVEELVAKKKPRVVTSDQALADKLRASGVEVRVVPQQSADAIARIGVEKIRAGQTVSAVELDATYIRRSDAEIKHLTQ
jgi:tRNA threonylcarbamoyladenosine biosynthesis protein TsaB